MDLLNEQDQIKILGAGYTANSGTASLYHLYFNALQNGAYPRADGLYRKWSYDCLRWSKDKNLNSIERYCILREVDQEGFDYLYRELFNPVDMTTWLRVTNNIISYNFSVAIYSIDDSAYVFWFDNKSLEEIASIRETVAAYIELNDVIVINEFTKFCLELGAKEENY